MSEFRSILERAGNALPPSDRDFDALHRRRDSRRRTKRITAGVVAVLVAAAGTATAFTAFGQAPLQQGVSRDRFFALWPEDTYEEAVEAQARIEAGGDAWRLNYASVAEEFGRQVLGWQDAWAPECRSHSDVREPCAEEGDALTLLLQEFHPSRIPDGSMPLRIHLHRLLRPGQGGAWSVTRVDIQDARLPFELGQTVEGPDIVTIHDIGRSESGWLVNVDFLEPGCPGSIGSATRRGSTLEFQLSGTPCPEPTRAIVALYRVAEGEAEGAISFDDPDGQRLIELSAVPVLLVQKEPEDPEGVYEPPPYPIPGAFAVWPEDTIEEAEPVQDAADGGDAEVAWRLDPEAVARRFVSDVMRRSVPEPVAQPTHAGDGGLEVLFEFEDGRSVVVIVAQAVRRGEGGIWSVTRVVSDIEVHYFSAGYDHDRIQGRVDPGSELEFVLEYGEGDPGARFRVSSDSDIFIADFREHFEGGVPIQDRTGHLLVGVVDQNGGYLTVFAMALPAGSWSHSQQQ